MGAGPDLRVREPQVRRRWWRVRVQFVPRDLWIGVYWKTEVLMTGQLMDTFFVCLVPMVPIVIQRRRRGWVGVSHR